MQTRYKIIIPTLLLGALGAWFASQNQETPKTTAQTERPSRPHKQKNRATRWPKLTDHRLPLETRLNIARRIDRSLSPRECTELFKLLRHQPTSADSANWWVVLNEIMEQMRKNGAGAEDYSATLSAILATPRAMDRPRQSRQPRRNRPRPPPGSPHSFCRHNISDDSLTHTVIPGTALMALTDASLRLPEEEIDPIWEKLDPVLSELITGTRSAELTLRVSAIQSAALRHAETQLPAIRSFASDENSNPSLRLSSIAALGLYTDPEDRDTLTKIANSNTRFQYAAKAALDRF